MKSIFKQSLIISIVMLVICGLIYPLAVTGLGQILFNKQANGSIIEYNGKKIGSALIGQDFHDTRFFHGRVSTVNYNTYTKADTIPDKNGKKSYNGVSSGSSNYAPSNKALEVRMASDINEFLKTHPGITKDQIPVDFMTASGSGLDPDISLQAAKIQISLISKTTGISSAELNNIVARNTSGKSLGIFGETRVNVLKANLEIANRLGIK